MIPRKQIDVRWGDLGYGLLACTGFASPAPDHDRRGRSLISSRADSLICLSVRSGFDLLLTEHAWAAGNEVLVSAITIPDMSRILIEHGLKPVPVDLDPETLAPDEAAWERAVTPRTRAVLVAHLFGSRVPLARLIAWAHSRGLLVLEDCAQAWTFDGFEGDAASDVRMFSFGTIKTATAFGGGVFLVKDAALLERLVARHSQWPMQRTSAYAKRLLKFSAYTAIQGPWRYGFTFWLINFLGGDADKSITTFGRGFAGGDFFTKLRHQPCRALKLMLAHRLAHGDVVSIEQRTAAGEFMLSQLQSTRPLGAGAERRTHWLFPLRVKNSSALRPILARAGFDATLVNSSLHAVPATEDCDAPRARVAMSEVLYVPVYAAMGKRRLTQLAALLNQHAEPVD
jgi:perosamine synthetase